MRYAGRPDAGYRSVRFRKAHQSLSYRGSRARSKAPPRARNYFLALGAVLVTVYNLTDLDADPNG